MGFHWRWDFTWDILPQLGMGALNTLLAAVLGYLIAMVIGLGFALLQRTGIWTLNRFVREVVEFIRSTPLVLQIFFVFYVGPQFGLTLLPWTAGMIAIGLHYAAYLSEVYRGALDATRLHERTDRGRGQALTNGADHSTRDEDELRASHGEDLSIRARGLVRGRGLRSNGPRIAREQTVRSARGAVNRDRD